MAKKKEHWKDALREAVQEAGSLAELGRRTGFSHVSYHLALKKGKQISAEMALAVSQQTGVERHRLRPDLWGPDD